MNTPTTEPKVVLPARLVYAAARLADQAGRADEHAMLLRALKAGAGDSGASRSWKALLASERSIGDLIPFERSAVDVAIAAFLFPSKRETVRLYSDLAIGELGFFSLGDHETHYIDRRPITPPDAMMGPCILEPQPVQALLGLLERIDREPLVARIPADGDALLEFEAPWLSKIPMKPREIFLEARLLVAPEIGEIEGGGDAKGDREMEGGGEPKGDREVKGRGSAAGDSGTLGARLGTFKLQAKAARTQWTLHAPPERVMEVHAASAGGQWLSLSSEALRLLMPLPDFLGDGAPVRAAIDPVVSYVRGLGADCSATCELPLAGAIRLASHPAWFFGSDPAFAVAPAAHLFNEIRLRRGTTPNR